MSSSTNNNSNNGPFQATERPNASSSRALAARNENTRDRVESPSDRASINRSSQAEHRPNSSTYTGLLSQNGSFGDQFWPVNDGGHSGNSLAGSKAWSTTTNSGTEGGSKDGGTKSQTDDSKVSNIAEAK